MNVHFYKYQGTGNDFILIDNRSKSIQLNQEQIAQLCDRRFGIGADGLMLLEEKGGFDFKMVYYNSDGNESTMCGNGGRCIAAFAKHLGVIEEQGDFLAIDGDHHAIINNDGTVSLSMQDVNDIERHDGYMVLDTGSPHYIKFVDDVAAVDVKTEGRAIRNEEPFKKEGININFVQSDFFGIHVRTYERGVEDETYSCGTGVTAAAIAFAPQEAGHYRIDITTPGGKLRVSMVKEDANHIKHILLNGPATYVYEGDIVV